MSVVRRPRRARCSLGDGDAVCQSPGCEPYDAYRGAGDDTHPRRPVMQIANWAMSAGPPAKYAVLPVLGTHPIQRVPRRRPLDELVACAEHRLDGLFGVVGLDEDVVRREELQVQAHEHADLVALDIEAEEIDATYARFLQNGRQSPGRHVHFIYPLPAVRDRQTALGLARRRGARHQTAVPHANPIIPIRTT